MKATSNAGIKTPISVVSASLIPALVPPFLGIKSILTTAVPPTIVNATYAVSVSHTVTSCFYLDTLLY